MAIKVQNNGGIGNPYHSEKTGEFVSAEYASGNMKPGDVKNYDKTSDSFDDDIDWDALFSGGDQNSKLNTYWNNKQKGVVPNKNIEEMTNQEMIEEINECKSFFDQKGIVFKNYNDFFYGDLKLKCSNFRMLKKIMQQYPIDMNGCEFIFSKQFKNLKKVAMTYPAYYAYNGFGDIIMSTFSLNKMMKFNHLFYRDYNSTKSIFKRQIEVGHWVDASDEMINSLAIAHEYGHLIAGDIINQQGLMNEVNDIYYSQRKQIKHEWFESKENQMQNDIKYELMQMYKQKYNLNESDFEKEISKYGKFNSKEFLAETFASMVCGKPNRIALIYEEYLKQYFNK